jgi:hypothetical protein
MSQKNAVQWAAPAFKASGHGGEGLYYLVAKVQEGRHLVRKTSKQGYHDIASANSDEARDAFLLELTPKKRKRSPSGVSSTPAKMLVVQTPSRTGMVGVDSLASILKTPNPATAVRRLSREFGTAAPPPAKTTGTPRASLPGKHYTQEEVEFRQEEAEILKEKKEQLIELMHSGHIGDLLGSDDSGHDIHLSDLSPADQRHLILKAVAVQFFYQLIDMPDDIKQLLIRLGSSLQGGSASKNDLQNLAGLAVARAGSTVHTYARELKERLHMQTQQRGKHEREFLLGDEELQVDCKIWIRRQKHGISGKKFLIWLMRGDVDDSEDHMPIFQREHVMKDADSKYMCLLVVGAPRICRRGGRVCLCISENRLQD